jgi:ribosomal-protein-serine acetyltransferase
MTETESVLAPNNDAGNAWPRPMAARGLDIRRLQRIHAPQWFSAVNRSRAELLKWEGWPQAARSEEEAHTLLENAEQDWKTGRAFHCGIFNEDALVGCVTVSNILWDCRCGDLGYWVDIDSRGKGISVWASRSLIDYCFRVLQLQRIELVIRVDNTASQRVAEKLGASFEGMARKRIFYPDRALDARIYAIVKEDEGPPGSR